MSGSGTIRIGVPSASAVSLRMAQVLVISTVDSGSLEEEEDTSTVYAFNATGVLSLP